MPRYLILGHAPGQPRLPFEYGSILGNIQCRVVRVPTMNAELSSPRSRLVRRIHLFLTVFERFGRNPNRREGYYTLLAIECLRAETYEEGDQAMQPICRKCPRQLWVALKRFSH